MGMLESLEWKEWASLKDSDIEHARKSMRLPLDEIISEVNESLDQFSDRLISTLNERNSLQELHHKLKRSQDILFHFHSFIKKKQVKEFLFPYGGLKERIFLKFYLLFATKLFRQHQLKTENIFATIPIATAAMKPSCNQCIRSGCGCCF